MNNILEYKGYRAEIKYYTESSSLHGIVIGIRDYVDFECDDLHKVEKEFHDAVDDYLDFCAEVGKEPEKEYRGQFNVRIDPSLHRELAYRAASEEKSINSIVEKAIAEYLNKDTHKTPRSGSNCSYQYVSEDGILTP